MRTGTGSANVSTMVPDPHATAEIAIVNKTGALTQRRMDPFGNARGSTPTWPGDHGFLDKPVDATGLVQVGARYYDPTTGRFVSVDPVMALTRPQQWNGYAYAENNPVTNTDPTGLLSIRAVNKSRTTPSEHLMAKSRTQRQVASFRDALTPSAPARPRPATTPWLRPSVPKRVAPRVYGPPAPQKTPPLPRLRDEFAGPASPLGYAGALADVPENGYLKYAVHYETVAGRYATSNPAPQRVRPAWVQAQGQLNGTTGRIAMWANSPALKVTSHTLTGVGAGVSAYTAVESSMAAGEAGDVVVARGAAGATSAVVGGAVGGWAMGATTGALVGTALAPGVGTAIGLIVGLAAGGLAAWASSRAMNGTIDAYSRRRG